MEKQTAVEWLLEQFPTIDKTDSYYSRIIEQAKQMEKEQIIEASHVMYMNGTTKYPITAEQYYNQTYNNDTKTEIEKL